MSDRKTPAEEIEALREATRAAHEAIKDMTRLIREMRAVKAEVETVATTVFAERMEAQVQAGLDAYRETLATAIEEATGAVHARFDAIVGILLGDGKGEESIEALARRKAGTEPGRPR